MTLRAGVSRRIIDPPLGTAKVGQRLYGDPITSIGEHLTGTVLVVTGETAKVAVVALDLCEMLPSEALAIRAAVADAIGAPSAHVLLNMSHNHSGPALPGYRVDDDDQLALKERYAAELTVRMAEAATEAIAAAVPARVGAGWGDSDIGVYRREVDTNGDVILGEVPDHPIDRSVGVVRVDDVEGHPIAVLFSLGCHAVVVGPNHHATAPDYPGPARDVLETALGGTALFLQACGGNISPRTGIGHEADGGPAQRLVGTQLGAEALRVAAGIRTDAHQSADRRPFENVPGILSRPWEPIDEPSIAVAAAAETVRLGYGPLPDLAEAERIHADWRRTLAKHETGDARDWELRVARWFTRWSATLVDAVRDGDPGHDVVIGAVRIGDIVLAGISMEAFFETGLAVKERSSFGHTQVLGYSNGSTGYLPRAEDLPPDGWQLDAEYHVPDLYVQAYMHPVALHPTSEQTVVDRLSALIAGLA
jgi:neutral ceramidase